MRMCIVHCPPLCVWLVGALSILVPPLAAMPFSADDLEVLKGMFEASNNSVMGKMDKFMEQQSATSKQLSDLAKLMSDTIQVKDDIANLRLEYDRKLRDLGSRMDSASASASTASTAGDSTPSWPASKKFKHTRSEPMMETALSEGGNVNRVWILGFEGFLQLLLLEDRD